MTHALRLISDELASRSITTSCPDCPMTRVDALAALIPPATNSCALRTLSVRSRAMLPARWFDEYGLAVVRRGIVVRQRRDAHGRAIAIDAVGAGGLVPLGLGVGAEANATGYAVSDALLCACPADLLRESMQEDRRTPRDLVHLQAQALDRVERLADARGRTTVTERVAAMIGALADVLSPIRSSDAVPSEIQQTDLAALVAARTETVCRSLCAIERGGLIARGVDGIRIVDRARLDAI